MIILERIPHESIREYVYRILRFNIIHLNLTPGQGISEQEIAATIHVSRTPVREAFIKLAQDNLLDIIPQKGTYVSLIDINQVEESKFVRDTLEREVIAMACQSFPAEELFHLQSHLAFQELCIKEKDYQKFFDSDENMHGTIFTGCNKTRTWVMIGQMNAQYNRVRMLNLSVRYDFEELFEQHQDLVRAIREHNVSLAQETINKHFHKMVIDLKLLQQEYQHYFNLKPVSKSKFSER